MPPLNPPVTRDATSNVYSKVPSNRLYRWNVDLVLVGNPLAVEVATTIWTSVRERRFERLVNVIRHGPRAKQPLASTPTGLLGLLLGRTFGKWGCLTLSFQIASAFRLPSHFRHTGLFAHGLQ